MTTLLKVTPPSDLIGSGQQKALLHYHWELIRESGFDQFMIKKSGCVILHTMMCFLLL